MTENERILENLKATLCDMVEIIDFETERDKQDVKELDNDVSKIIDLLDELEEYRTIGTVEDIEKSMQNVSVLLAEHELLKLYQAIGTIEEFKALKEKSEPKKVIDLQINKMQSFCEDDFGREIPCTIKVFQFYCPNCNRKIASIFKINKCTNCNQKLDWQ